MKKVSVERIITAFSLSLLLLLLLSLPTQILSVGRCNLNDEKVLLRIKESFGSPFAFSSWNPDLACCKWYGVKCDFRTHRVISLTAFPTELSGTIPPEVGDLPYLQFLTFHKMSNLTGEIQPAISKLTRLIELQLSSNNLTGPVPAFLSKLHQLRFLDLSFNQLSGTIPPELSQFRNLQGLRLDRNQLTGTIPDSLGNFAGSTPNLFLSHNHLTGKVPVSLGNLNFTTLDFSRNLLQGDISFLFGINKTVQIADFSRNMFEFDLTKVEFPASLTSLDLNHNRIYGSLPEGLTALDFQYLNVSYNRLCGPIPTGGSLQKFGTTEYFHNRCLCGAPLPPCS